MFGQSSKSVPKSGFAQVRGEVNARGSSDQIFQIAVISEYVSKFDQASKKKKERRRKKKPQR